MAGKEKKAIKESKNDEMSNKPKIVAAFGRFFKAIGRFFMKIIKFFGSILLELKKVTWPTRKQVIVNTLSVLAFCLVVGAIIWLCDFGMGSLMTLIERLR